MPTLRRLLRAAQSLVPPPACLLCGARIAGHEPRLCPACAARVELVRPPLCRRCGMEFLHATGSSHFCGNCLVGPPAFSKARAVIRYSRTVAPLIHDFKYRGRTSAVNTFAAWFAASEAVRDLDPADIIIPVPLHKRRLRQRRFNQSLALARVFMAAQKGKIAPRLLVRRRATPPQAGLGGTERRRNLKNAFVCPDPPAVAGRRVLLVDDVFTTGATLHECAGTLRRAGAKDVQALTLARVKG